MQVVNQHALAGSAPALSRIAEFRVADIAIRISIQYRAADDRQPMRQDSRRRPREASPSLYRGTPSTSGYRIVTNLYIDEVRKRKRTPTPSR